MLSQGELAVLLEVHDKVKDALRSKSASEEALQGQLAEVGCFARRRGAWRMRSR